MRWLATLIFRELSDRIAELEQRVAVLENEGFEDLFNFAPPEDSKLSD